MKEIISHVVAFSENMVIGIDNKLPWNLPKDLQHFKNYTINKSIIMGRKTYESIGRPLPNRNNIVISKTLSDLEGIYVCESLDDALNQARTLNKNAHCNSTLLSCTVRLIENLSKFQNSTLNRTVLIIENLDLA